MQKEGAAKEKEQKAAARALEQIEAVCLCFLNFFFFVNFIESHPVFLLIPN